MTDEQFRSSTEVLGAVTLLVFGALAILMVVLTVRRARNPNWRRDLWIGQTASRRSWAGTAAGVALGIVPVVLVLSLFPVAPILPVALGFGALVVLAQVAVVRAIARRPPEEHWFRESDEPDTGA
ncbi:MAG TPA: hypothetical protein VIL55_05020 [Naasia sp.]